VTTQRKREKDREKEGDTVRKILGEGE